MLKWICNLLSMTDKSRISRWLPLTPQTNLLLGNGLATDGRGPDEVAAACCCCGSCCGGVATAVPGRTIGGGLNDPPGLCVFFFRKQYSSLMSKTDRRMRSKLGFIVCLFSIPWEFGMRRFHGHAGWWFQFANGWFLSAANDFGTRTAEQVGNFGITWKKKRGKKLHH